MRYDAHMTRALLFMVLAGAPLVAAAADDYKTSQLEQAVRNLQRQVDEHGRQLDELRRRLSATPPPASLPPARAPAVAVADSWVDAAKWRQLKNGMTELEVLGILGAPTSMRVEGSERVLLYAIEIGTSGFLGGSVTLRDRVVTAIEKPLLK